MQHAGAQYLIRYMYVRTRHVIYDYKQYGNKHWWVVYKVYPWSGLYSGRTALGWRTLFAHSSLRITPGVNVWLAAAPFLWAAPFPARGGNARNCPFSP